LEMRSGNKKQEMHWLRAAQTGKPKN